MRKHFLLLFLMALLPLAGFAQEKTSISDWTVTLSSDVPLVYNGAEQNLPTLTNIKKGEVTVSTFGATDWALSWSFRGTPIAYTDAKGTNAGVYTLTITATADNATYTGSVSKAYTISKKDVTVTATDPASITYGQVLPANDEFYDVAGYISGHEYVGDPVTISTIDNTTAGDKPFTITAKTNIENYNIVVPSNANSGILKINKVALDVQAKAFADFTYGAKQLSDITKEVTYSGFVNDETDAVLGGSLTFKVNKAAAGTGTEFEGYGGAGTWYIIPGGLTSSNYDINFINSTFTVSALTLDTADEDFTLTVEDDTYNATAYNPEPTVKWKGVNLMKATTEPVAANDYSFVYTSDAAGNTVIADATTIKNAGKYYVKITGAGNFTGSVVIPFDIKKAELRIRSKNQTKTYDAKPFAFPATLTYADATANDYYGKFVTITGWQGTTDNFSNVFKTGKKLTLTQNATTAGDYTITVADNRTGEEDDDDIFTNYTPKYGSLGVLTINKKTIYVQAKNVSKKYGEEIPAKYNGNTAVAAGDVIVGTSNEMTDGQITADANALATDGTTQDVITTYPKLTKAAGTTKGHYPITVTKAGMVIKHGTGGDAVTSSYDIQVLDGDYNIAGKSFTIWADPKESFYGEDKVALTASIEGMTVSDANTLKADIEGALKLPANATNAKEYDIELDETALKNTIATGANAELWQNYETETFDFVSDKYTIKRAELTVKAKPQVRMRGEKVIDAASAATIEFEGTAPTGNDLKLIYNALKLTYALPDNVDDVPATTEVDESITYLTAEKELADGALAHGLAKADDTHPTDYDTEDGVWYNGIVIDPATLTAYNAANAPAAEAEAIKNYTLVLATVAYAQLTVTTSDVLVLDAEAATNSGDLTANAGKKLNVTIDNKNMNANKWYTISLPFAITPFDFCKAINGYAIFDRLQKTGDKLSFKISLDEIPAYTPFLVKVDSRVELGSVIFEKVTVEAPAVVETEKNDTWIVKNTIDAGDVEGLVYWLASDREDGLKLDLNETKGNFRGFDAYFTTVDGQKHADARIFIEEPDGTTTAISNIAADGEMIPAEGWYTLNGVKLQGMPTEKGVYINNGKKIVVK